MNANLWQAQQFIQYARQALRNGDRSAARRWAEQAAELAPQLEDPWLILAAVASPRASLTFIERALQINPNSPRALQGMQWALKRLQEKPGAEKKPGSANQAQAVSRSGSETLSKAGSSSKGAPQKARRLVAYPILLLVLGCLAVAFAAWTAGVNPALASIFSAPSQTIEREHPRLWAQVEIAKPTYTPQPDVTLAQAEPTSPSPTPTALFPTFLPDIPPLSPDASTPDIPPPDALTPETPLPDALTPDAPPPDALTPDTPTPEVVSTPGQLVMEVLADTPTPQAPPTSEYTPPTAKPVAGNGARWIDINLSEQRLYAYEGDVAINVFIVSTGTWATPTVTGTFKIWNKTRVQDMSGPGYYLPNVPYVMYFYKDYGIHGTYWHNNFGTPMSHGCVNLSIPDAEWLYYWAYEGMTVRVHY